jgi:hypothetical protein
MNFQEQLVLFHQELTRLTDERDNIDRQISGVLDVIKSLADLVEDAGEEPVVPQLAPEAEAGFTDRVRTLLQASPGRALTAIQIRNAFVEVDPKQDSRVMLIHAHNTLKRLLKQNEVDEVQTTDGRVAYKWKFGWMAESANLASKLSLSSLAGLAAKKISGPDVLMSANDAASGEKSEFPNPLHPLRKKM